MILFYFYSKTAKFTFHPGVRPYTKSYIEKSFRQMDERGRYQLNNITGDGIRTGESGSPWHGYNPTASGRHWAIQASLNQFLPNQGEGMPLHQKLDMLYEQGIIIFPQKAGGQPRYKQYVGPGIPYQDIWAFQPGTEHVLEGSDECIDADVKYFDNEEEKLGYGTQKPMGLLARIINTSSNSGDVVLDPFCGCGTTIEAAEKLGRQWIGIDITSLAIGVISDRLKPSKAEFQIIGWPKDRASAAMLAQTNALQGRYDFQDWAVWMLEGLPNRQDSAGKSKKGADGGYDGYITFYDGKSYHDALISVKSGKLKADDLRALGDTVRRKGAAIGVLLTLEPPSKDMMQEAQLAPRYHSETWGRSYPGLQIITVEQLFSGVRVDMPPHTKGQMTRQAQGIERGEGEQMSLIGS